MASKHNKKSHVARNTSSTRHKRLWLFRIISLIIIPLLFFGGLEIVLRLSGFGYPTHAIIKTRVNGKTCFRDNYMFAWRFTSKIMGSAFNDFLIEPQKSPKTYRIFILGASAAMGFPDPSVDFGHILEIMLRERYPDTNFEVINTAFTAINSHVVLPIAKDCAKLEPDMFIVYLGNNEVVGPYGPGTVFTPLLPSLKAIRANIWLKSTRTGQLLETVGSLFNDRNPPEWEGMEMFFDNQVRYDDPALQSVYSHFEQNLTDICETGIKNGAKVIVSNVASNLKDSPPFASLHKDLTETEKQQWDELYQQGVELEAAGGDNQAIENYLAAERIDETFADLQFRLGKCLWNTGLYEGARTRYIKAMEYDTLRFRANGNINDIISSVAKDRTSEGLYFVDAVKAVENNSPHQTPGSEHFYEHVHYKFDGNYIVAKALFEQVEKVLPGDIKETKRPGEVLSKETCERRLAYTEWDRHTNLSMMLNTLYVKPPFTNQLYYDETIDRINRTLGELETHINAETLKNALTLYKTSLEKYPHHWQRRWKYCLLLEQTGAEMKEILKQMKILVETVPVAKAYHQIGQALYAMGDTKEAINMLEKSIKLKPTSPESYVLLGNIYRDTFDSKRAVKYYSKAIAVKPTASVDAYIFSARIYHSKRQTDKAIQTVRNGIDVFPEEQTAKLHYFLGEILFSENRVKEAREEYKRVLELDPGNQFAQKRLNQSGGF